MANFAQLDINNLVLQTIVLSEENCGFQPFPASEPIGVSYLQTIFGADTIWKQTSYNGNFRYNFAGEGYSYDAVNDAFVAPQPYPEWILNTDTYRWEPPVPYPSTGGPYWWDEETGSWRTFS